MFSVVILIIFLVVARAHDAASGEILSQRAQIIDDAQEPTDMVTNRAIIGFEPGADWASIKRGLIAAGAESVREPSNELPDALVVTLPADRSIEAFLQAARVLPGVRYAEQDAWRSTY